MSDDELRLKINSSRDCFDLAQSEADKYQRLINDLAAAEGGIDRLQIELLTAKRDAASRIAMLIRYGLLIALILIPTSARAQSLRLPTAVFASAAAADWASTYRAISRYHLHEDNPLINRLADRPTLMITAGAALDTVGAAAWLHYVGRRHSRIAAAGLYVAAAGRFYLAARNVSRSRRTFWSAVGPVLD